MVADALAFARTYQFWSDGLPDSAAAMLDGMLLIDGHLARRMYHDSQTILNNITRYQKELRLSDEQMNVIENVMRVSKIHLKAPNPLYKPI